MAALAVRGDVPPNELQPSLRDGVHLRWATERSLGFPWYGFYLLRRDHEPGKPTCGGSEILDLLTSQGPSSSLESAIGTLRSDTDMAVTHEFAGQPGVDLRGHESATLERPEGAPARWARVTLGFLEGGGKEEQCLALTAVEKGDSPNPFDRDGFEFTVSDSVGERLPSAGFRDWPTPTGPRAGLDCGWATTVRLPRPATVVTLTLTSFGAAASVEAVGAGGQIVATRETAAGLSETLSLEGGAPIVAVRIAAPQNELALHEICIGESAAAGGHHVRVTALHGEVPIAGATMTGLPGEVVTAALDGDCIDALRIAGGQAVLLDVCVVPAQQGIGDGWEQLHDVASPLPLPVQHPDYPPLPLSVDLGQSESIALSRVLYGDPAEWSGDAFAELHNLLLSLVEGGPGGTPMADREQSVTGVFDGIATDFEPPTMPQQRPLDLVLLGAIHAPIAELVGLMCTDRDVSADGLYDYMVVADHSGVGGLDVARVRQLIAAQDFGELDAWACFGVPGAPAAPLAAPSSVRAYALPGATTSAADGALIEATSCVGLRWPGATSPGGTPLPREPVLHHVWRAGLGDAELPETPSGYDPLTRDEPVMVVRPEAPSGVDPPPDWPPLTMHIVDSGVEEGWYAYEVSGVDIFGRHSASSPAATWYQWAPAPDPPPWYYVPPSRDAAIHPRAVRLLDKIAPPQPTGVEAFVVDPADPYALRDGLHAAWFDALGAGEKSTLVGLRVRWTWTEAHRLAAPRTKEFRIYWNPGTDPPAGHERGTAWARRLFVVPYADHWTAGTDDDGRPLRRYELILPPTGDPVRIGADLPVTQAAPMLYANVGVAAADGRPHTPDALQWTGRWAGRPGNESDVGPVAKVFRVHRAPPDAPLPAPSDERAFATPADYHSHSFYTYRWRPSPNLKTHIFRAVDDSIFQADWPQRPRAALVAADPAFPTLASDPRWNAAKRSGVMNELNRLNTFAHTAAGRELAFAHYRGLTNDALRVLASLPGNDQAFTQLTNDPLDPAWPATANRVGPDNPLSFAVDPSLRIWIDTLDGRSVNRWLHRAGYVDGVHNRGPMSIASGPVWLPNVLPPRRPTIVRVTLDDAQATVVWASNREPDLASYRVYRGIGDERLADVRDVDLVHEEPVAAGPPTARPAEVAFVDTGVVGGLAYAYRVVAVDTAGNASAPSEPYEITAIDRRPPERPAFLGAEWVVWQAISERVDPWPPGGTIPADRRPALRVRWENVPDRGRVVITRRQDGDLRFRPVSTEARVRQTTPGVFELVDPDVSPELESAYRLATFSAAGLRSAFTEVEVPVP